MVHHTKIRLSLYANFFEISQILLQVKTLEFQSLKKWPSDGIHTKHVLKVLGAKQLIRGLEGGYNYYRIRILFQEA